jgi:hypothetical protein
MEFADPLLQAVMRGWQNAVTPSLPFVLPQKSRRMKKMPALDAEQASAVEMYPILAYIWLISKRYNYPHEVKP